MQFRERKIMVSMVASPGNFKNLIKINETDIQGIKKLVFIGAEHGTFSFFPVFKERGKEKKEALPNVRSKISLMVK